MIAYLCVQKVFKKRSQMSKLNISRHNDLDI